LHENAYHRFDGNDVKRWFFENKWRLVVSILHCNEVNTEDLHALITHIIPCMRIWTRQTDLCLEDQNEFLEHMTQLTETTQNIPHRTTFVGAIKMHHNANHTVQIARATGILGLGGDDGIENKHQHEKALHTMYRSLSKRTYLRTIIDTLLVQGKANFID
jgi:hypothetical protein